ncbi:TolC family protein [Marinilabiliaceae bacterium JC017]|nr:TolC family protein [Marinilabiliaceae bacterium JC017]
MYRKALLLIATASLSLIPGKGQEKTYWPLDKCIEYAHENNITIKRQKLNADYSQNEYNKSKLAIYPNLNANSDYTVGFGRVYDTPNNTYNDQTTQMLSGGVNTNVSLFEGFTKQNSIKKGLNDFKKAQEDVKKIENDISLQITAQFLQVLFNKELLNVAKEQLRVTMLQVERSKKLVDAGSQAMGSYLEIKSQSAKEALNVTKQENNLAISLLNLAQLLDLEDPMTFDIETPVIPDVTDFASERPVNIYETALGIMPEIKSSNYNLESNQYQLKTAKGYYYPKVTLGAGWSTQASKIEGKTDFDLSNDLKNNSNSFIGLKLSIPIFNGLQSRINVKNAQIGVADAQYQLENEKLNLRKVIQQAYADAIRSFKNYQASEEAVESYKESFRYTEKKFNVGLVNSVDYNVAKTDFTKAQSDLLQGKYEYILRTKILDFYRGIPIKL